MYKFDLHVHTKYSNDSRVEPRDIIKTAKEKDIDYVAITDHDTIKGWKEINSKRITPGIEVSSKDGHILGVFIEEKVEKGLSAEETIRRIHEQGGLAIAPHPFEPLRKGLWKKTFKLDLDAIEIFNSKSSFFNFLNSHFGKKVDLPKLASSDAHFLCNIGKGLSGSKYKPKRAILKNEITILRKEWTSFRKNLKNLWFKLLRR